MHGYIKVISISHFSPASRPFKTPTSRPFLSRLPPPNLPGSRLPVPVYQWTGLWLGNVKKR